MELKVKRKIFTDTYTIGRWYANGVDMGCDSLEDAVRDTKIFGKTAIPAGRYHIIMSYSPRFKRDMPILLDVPNYEGVRIHPYNTSLQTEGCLAGGIHNPDYNGGDWIANSAHWTGIISEKIEDAIRNGEKVFITMER